MSETANVVPDSRISPQLSTFSGVDGVSKISDAMKQQMAQMKLVGQVSSVYAPVAKAIQQNAAGMQQTLQRISLNAYPGLGLGSSAVEFVNALNNLNPMVGVELQNQISRIASVENSYFKNQLGDISSAASKVGFNNFSTAAFEAALNSIGGVQRAAYSRPTETPEYYSEAMNSPADYFDPYAQEISDVDSLHRAISKLAKVSDGSPLVWRGQGDASWGLHSKLFRHLMDQNGVQNPTEHPHNKQPYPTETQMVQAEDTMLRLARDSWRLGNMPALEIFARIQHFGGPTRLLDATRNPYIAAWFAVQECDDKTDGRLFALATTPAGGDPPHNLSLETQKADPFWFQFSDIQRRPLIEWGTGSRRIIWVPPVYESRIAAQDAVFILDGTPITTSKVLRHFEIPRAINNGRRQYWKRPDILAAASIYVKMSHPNIKPRSNQLGLAPTYNFRIKASAKESIRDYLTKSLGYTVAAIYPDLPGLARHVNQLTFSSLKDIEAENS